MADLLHRASDWLGGMFQTHASQSVAYIRGTKRVRLDATRGKTEWEADSRFGVEKTRTRDWLFPADSLRLPNLGRTEPIQGDLIEVNRGGVTYTYKVTAPREGPPWRFSDEYQQTIRVYTVEVKRS